MDITTAPTPRSNSGFAVRNTLGLDYRFNGSQPYVRNRLEGGAEDPWNHAVLWIYAGFICMDVGDMAEAKFALERAQALDPGNQALKIQLALMEKGGQ